MPSLRRRLMLGTAIGSAAVLIGGGLVLYALVRASLQAEFDRALAEKAATLAGMVEQEGDRVEVEFVEADMPEFRRSSRPEYFQLWSADGQSVAGSASLGGKDLPKADAGSKAAELQAIILPDGRPGRRVTVTFVPRIDDEHRATDNSGRLVMSLAADTLDVDRTLGTLRAILFAVGASAILLLLGLLSWLVSVGLQPVQRLASEIGGLDERCLSRRIEVGGTPVELLPIVDRLNEALARLDAAFAREKSMTAAMAHELRTPLAALRATLEVALAKEREPSAYRAAIEECLGICRQSQRMVENLLALARLDSAHAEISNVATDVGALVIEAWKPFEKKAQEKRLKVRLNVAAPLSHETDPDKLRLVLVNLFDNAVEYCDIGGDIDILARQDARSMICISNTGCRLLPEELDRVFDRFWRGDKARTDGSHCGLGLSLCKMIVERMGGTIRAELPGDGRFEIVVKV